MMRGERGLWMGAVIAVAVLASARGGVAGRAAEVEARLTHLEVELARLKDAVRDEGLRLTDLDQRQRAAESRLSELLPDTARWLTLAPGGTVRWEPALGGQAYLQFIRAEEDGRAPVVHFRVDPVDEVESALRPGETLEMIDDRGSEKRIFRLTLHRLSRETSGRARGLFSLQAVRSE